MPVPVFRIDGGDESSPVVLHVPHSSRRISGPARASIALDDTALLAELDAMTDAYTDLIAARAAAAARVRPWTFVNEWSRLVVDPERFPDDEREEMAAVGMGAVYTRTSSGQRLRPEDPPFARRLRDAHFHPYAQGMTALVDERLAATGRAIVVDVHSYPARALPYELHGDGPRPQVCLGTDGMHTPPWLRDAAAKAFAGYEVGFDSPFAGCYVPLKHHGADERVSALMVELRRDGYQHAPGGEPHSGLDRLAASLATLVDALGAR
ncbi:N-formylglutamate amidohydrolase [Catellatospora methionotrophica]|uniref:N-formylglutamate amidohydrolase n=1 Tax=Catellatospora methionotrophica TaxID=121620 RepID=UPI0034004890